MPYCQTFLLTTHFSCFGLEPDTPETDYEIHFVKAADPAYLPPDSEAWPLYYHAVLDALQGFPEAFSSVVASVRAVRHQLTGRRGLPPQAPHSPKRPNEPNPLPSLSELGPRTYQRRKNKSK